MFWTVSLFFFFLSIEDLGRLIREGRSEFRHLDIRAMELDLKTLQGIADSLRAGLIPPESEWSSLSLSKNGLGKTAGYSLRVLREGGRSIMETLERFMTVINSQIDARGRARRNSSQPLFQLIVLCASIPLAGLLMFMLFSELRENRRDWLILLFLGSSVGFLGLVTGLRMVSDSMRLAVVGVDEDWQQMVIAMIEYYNSMIRGGDSPDRAWDVTYDFAVDRFGEGVITQCWGPDIWTIPSHAGLPKEIVEIFERIRKIAQNAISQGRNCLKAIDVESVSFQRAVESKIDQQIERLGLRLLLPLFALMFPGVLIQLMGAIWIVSRDALL